MAIKPESWYDPKLGHSVRIVVEGLPRTFSGFSSKAAALRAGELQQQQIVVAGKPYSMTELRQLGLCGQAGSYEAALSSRRDKFGVVLEDGSIKRLTGIIPRAT